MRIKVKTTPRSRVVRLDNPEPDGVWQARVQAPPVDGKANEAVVRLLAERFDVPKSRIALVSGETSRLKTFEIPDP